MIIDDDPMVCKLIGSFLRDRGCKIVFTQALSALESIKNQTFDLCLLDWKMPGKSGLEILHELRANAVLASLPVIMMSGMAQNADVIHGLNEGADDYLTKPFSLGELEAQPLPR